MAQKKYVLGVDGGTESIRCGVFDLTGQPIGFASTPYKTHFPEPGWAEQTPEDWWNGIVCSVRKVLEETKIPQESIISLGLDTTCCSVVALDEFGNSLMPCLLWMDMRSAEQTKQVLATGDPVLKVNSGGAGPVSAEWMIPKALWIKQNRPDVFHKATYVCEYQDYLNFKLTGHMCASINNVSVRWHYSANESRPEDRWPCSLLQSLDLSDLVTKWPMEVLPLGAPVGGGLTAKAAAQLGLPEGLPVAQGGADAFIGMLGLGVTSPGQLALITGSSHLLLGVAPNPVHAKGIFGTYVDALLPGTHVIEGGQTSTGSILNWFKTLVGGGGSFYEDMNAAAAEIPIGSEGLVMLDHFQVLNVPFRKRSSLNGV
jgi:ribulose kinase